MSDLTKNDPQCQRPLDMTSTHFRSTMNGKPVFVVPSQTVLNLDSGFRHKLLCDGPTFSTGMACVYSCTFCYVPDMTRKQIPWLQKNGVPVAQDAAPLRHEDVVIRRANAVELLRQQLARPAVRRIAGRPLVIYTSPAVDVAGNMVLVQETVAACRLILEQTHWHIRLLSKSNLLPEIARLLESYRPGWKSRLIFGVSTGTLDDQLGQAVEAGTPLVSKRIASLHWLQDHGFRTYGMICPSLPQRDYDQFARDIAAAIRADRCEHVWAEVINLRGESFTRTIAALEQAGYDWEVEQLRVIARDKNAWENYARQTFEAHARVADQRAFGRRTNLRFLQYVTAQTRPWWSANVHRGAILL